MNFMDPFQGHLFPTRGLHVARGGDKTCRKRTIKRALEALRRKEMGIPSVSLRRKGGWEAGSFPQALTPTERVTGAHLAPLRTEGAEIFKQVM